MEITEKDRAELAERGVSEARLAEQLEMLRQGFPYLKIAAPATLGNGIKGSDSEVVRDADAIWERYVDGGQGKVMKMVPASGAASRMFKDVFAFADGKAKHPDSDFMKKFFAEIEKFAFFRRLNLVCIQLEGKSLQKMLDEGRYREVASLLLGKDGLNYGQMPKGLLLFHKVLGSARTPIEEHMAEGAQYAAGKDGNVHIHFTVSPDHLAFMQRKVQEVEDILSHKYGVHYDVTFSVQKPSTDTVAATMKGEPYRENGSLFFRPGGHGALIENLNDLDADVVFIKNIDNVVPDSKRAGTIRYKKLLGGVLVAVKSKADHYCRLLKEGKATDAQLQEMLQFLREVLCVTHDDADAMSRADLCAYLMGKLNRPMRVCGMVKNEGEPGGGPFLAYNPDGTVSPQILEGTQIDPKNREAQRMLKESTHFNPVDLVCALKDFEGRKFNLPDYVDRSTGFISEKSRAGVEIKALELPGLWNGAMSDWNTVLVEVPSDTFNPVKTVNDLLRPAHQSESQA